MIGDPEKEYIYDAIDTHGNKMHGAVWATNKTEAKKELVDAGLTHVKVKSPVPLKSEINFILPTWKKKIAAGFLLCIVLAITGLILVSLIDVILKEPFLFSIIGGVGVLSILAFFVLISD